MTRARITLDWPDAPVPDITAAVQTLAENLSGVTVGVVWDPTGAPISTSDDRTVHVEVEINGPADAVEDVRNGLLAWTNDYDHQVVVPVGAE